MQDVFELQRNLNNAFAYDLVPSPAVITAALKAARRVNDFPTAVRIFEGTFLLTGFVLRCIFVVDFLYMSWLEIGIKAKVENKMQYDEYLKELEPLREELGISLKETLYPD